MSPEEPGLKPNDPMKTPSLNKKIKVMLPKIQLSKTARHFSLRQLLIFMLVFAGIGGYIIYKSFAVTPVVATIQAESMTMPTGASVVADSAASGGQAVKFTANGTASGTVNLPSNAVSMGIAAKGVKCKGATPRLTVTVDGATVLSQNINSSGWQTFSVTKDLISGSHNLTATYAATRSCSYLFLDVFTFYGPAPTVIPAPTVAFSASPTSITAGQASMLTWSSTNATGCAASGGWSSAQTTSGSTSTGALNATTTYTLTCTGNGGSISGSATVTVSGTTSVAWPASYTNGPLGANNILPATANGVLLMENFGESGSSGIAYNESSVLQRETDISRKFDAIHIHYGGGGTYNGIANCIYMDSYKQEQWVHDNGSVPVVSWMPNATLANINSGSVDQCITSVANYYKQYPFRVMMRLGWEMDGDWFTWAACGTYKGAPLAGSSPQAFVSAWQRIVNIFKQQGATKVGFWWTPTEGYNRTCATDSYPGDAYVDWVGVDTYNHDRNDVWTTPLHSGWAEFNEETNYTKLGSSVLSKHDQFGPRKPFMIGETGSTYDTTGVPSGHVADPNRKANWFRNIASVAAPQLPYFHGLSFFDQWLVSEGNDWHVDHNQPSIIDKTHPLLPEGTYDATTYQGFKDMSHAVIFNSGVAGGAN